MSVLQNARVLAIDQIADERTDKPSVVKAVTLEVDITGAQRLSLASQVGNLSLALRKAGESGCDEHAARYARGPYRYRNRLMRRTSGRMQR